MRDELIAGCVLLYLGGFASLLFLFRNRDPHKHCTKTWCYAPEPPYCHVSREVT